MEVGFVGLGKMGTNMVRRLRGGGHEVVGYDVVASRSDVPSLDALVKVLVPPLWGVVHPPTTAISC